MVLTEIIPMEKFWAMSPAQADRGVRAIRSANRHSSVLIIVFQIDRIGIHHLPRIAAGIFHGYLVQGQGPAVP